MTFRGASALELFDGDGEGGRGADDDVAYGAKYLVARGLVDPKRMAFGISHCATKTIYTSYATRICIAQTSSLRGCQPRSIQPAHQSAVSDSLAYKI